MYVEMSAAEKIKVESGLYFDRMKIAGGAERNEHDRQENEKQPAFGRAYLAAIHLRRGKQHDEHNC